MRPAKVNILISTATPFHLIHSFFLFIQYSLKGASSSHHTPMCAASARPVPGCATYCPLLLLRNLPRSWPWPALLLAPTSCALRLNIRGCAVCQPMPRCRVDLHRAIAPPSSPLEHRRLGGCELVLLVVFRAPPPPSTPPRGTRRARRRMSSLRRQKARWRILTCACCMCMFQVFQMFQKNIVSVLCGCCKSRSRYFICMLHLQWEIWIFYATWSKCCGGFFSHHQLLTTIFQHISDVANVNFCCCKCFK